MSGASRKSGPLPEMRRPGWPENRWRRLFRATVLGTALHDGGRFAEALAAREEALAIYYDQGLLSGEMYALISRGMTARRLGSYDTKSTLGRQPDSVKSSVARRTQRCQDLFAQPGANPDIGASGDLAEKQFESTKRKQAFTVRKDEGTDCTSDA